ERAVLERAFEPFFTTKRGGAGSGLGLSMVHAIMRDHEGSVKIESEVGHGTSVHCYFPAISVEEHEMPVTSETIPCGRGERVLLVDDEPALARIGQRRLEELGYAVTMATDSMDALTAFRADPAAFDIVVTDYYMPRLTGLDLATQIVEARPDMPILMMT